MADLLSQLGNAALKGITGGASLKSAASSFLKDAGAAFIGNEYLRDFQHASKTFVAGNYAYSPKYKFLFHVYFDINTTALGSVISNWPQDNNFGLAVKTIQLPKFSIDTTTLNQYNRKRIVQTKIKYDPVSVVFHDDNNNMIRKMWYSYYSYYYKDPNQTDTGQSVATVGPALPGGATDINRRTIYDNSIAGSEDWGYSGETTSVPDSAKVPFFKAINIYGFNQHNFVLYRLINPMIDSFQHDQYDYSQGNGTMTHTMNLQYESVKYLEGAIDGKNPSAYVQGFGDQTHYDTTLSPIARPGSQSTILGQGGLVDGVGGIMDDLASGNILGAVQKAGATAQTFKNPANVLKIATAEAVGIASDAITNTPNRNTFNFPTGGASLVQQTTNAVNSAYQGLTKPKTPPTNG